MDDLEKQALKMMGKQHPFKRRVSKKMPTQRYKPGKSGARQIQMLRDIQAGKKIYVSTLDVEMSKWRFKEATGKELILTQNVDTTIYRATINEE